MNQDNIYNLKNQKLFSELKELISKDRRVKFNLNNGKYPDILNWINECLPLLQNDLYRIDTKLYWILNGLTDFPKCKYCNKEYSDRNVESLNNGYTQYCSHKCAVNSDEIKEKTKQTCLKKYGAISPGQVESVKEKCKQTCLKKYGVACTLQAAKVKEKTKETLLKKYGVEHISQVDDVKTKVAKTKFERYGENNPWHSKSAYEKRKLNWQNKYGVDHIFKLASTKEKAKETIFKKYGVDHTSKIPGKFKKIRKTYSYYECILKNKYDEPLFSFDEYLKFDINDLLKFKCKKCGNVFETKHLNGVHRRCEKCYPVEKSTSDEEKAVLSFIKSFYSDKIIENSKEIISPLELDIYIPEKKLAIEFDGLYWHSNEIKPQNYHLNKTIDCEKHGINLIHIFENEWLYKQDIVKSRLKNLFGVYDKTIYARQCKIKEVSSKESKAFQDNNHIQGAVNSSINLGLYFNDYLISLMTFGKCRFNKKYEYELLRFCNKLGYHIPGSASKILKYFERNYQPKSLISYADRRWSKGNVYEKLGFKLTNISKPNYWYFRNSDLILESRVKYQKHKLASILDNFDENKSEIENMKANGYNRIFDCGNLVYTKIF